MDVLKFHLTNPQLRAATLEAADSLQLPITHVDADQFTVGVEDHIQAYCFGAKTMQLRAKSILQEDVR